MEYHELVIFLTRTVKDFRRAMRNRHRNIGTAVRLWKLHCTTRKKLKSYMNTLERENELTPVLEQLYELVKLSYENFMQGNVSATRTYLYHMEGMVEDLRRGRYRTIKLPI